MATQQKYPEFEKSLSLVKIRLMERKDSAFFASLAFSFRHIADDSIPTACTDGKTCRYNPREWALLDPQEQLFLFLHEVLHPAYHHLTRRGKRDPKIWNYACDYVINQHLVDRGFKKPSWMILDERFRGMSADQVYDILVQENFQPPPDLLLDLREPPQEADTEELEKEIGQILTRAAIRSKQQQDSAGTIPADLAMELDRMRQPYLPWHQILARFATSMAKTDYSWQRPNRKYFPQYYLPSMWSEAIPSAACALDVSGSITKENEEDFIGHTARILKAVCPEKINVLQFNTRIAQEDTVRNLQDLNKVEIRGGGGTNIFPVMEWAEKHEPKFLVVFTDGYFQYPSEGPNNTQVIWVVHGNPRFSIRFGKIIHYNP